MTNISDIPDDLIYNILARLPLKTVFTLRTLSRDFKELLEEESLVMANRCNHRVISESYNTNQIPAFLVVLTKTLINPSLTHFHRLLICDVHGNVTKDVALHSNHYRILLSVAANGLYWLRFQTKGEDSMTVVCNPFSGGRIKISPINSWDTEGDDTIFTTYSFCIGFDPAASRCTLIRFRKEISKGAMGDGKFIIDVYECRTEVWRTVEVRVSLHWAPKLEGHSPVYSARTRCFYWIYSEEHDRSQRTYATKVGVFRPGDDSFRTIALPPECPCKSIGEYYRFDEFLSRDYRCWRRRIRDPQCQWRLWASSDGDVFVMYSRQDEFQECMATWKLVDGTPSWVPQHYHFECYEYDYECSAMNCGFFGGIESDSHIDSYWFRVNNGQNEVVLDPAKVAGISFGDGDIYYYTSCYSFSVGNIRWPWPSHATVPNLVEK